MFFPAALASFVIVTAGYTWASHDASAFVLLMVSFPPSHCTCREQIMGHLEDKLGNCKLLWLIKE